ncbi:MAG TPA: hypothetical protein PLN33_14200 [Hyphomonadaceae bacterium]|jgi:hypothetical protein|nr:hypothetical protein [Hyphomonadaceae bacterium]HPN05792.1 hypothetical protein [Hyphomonadaceae bacterium]
MGLDLDLAALAGMAGLGGSAIAGLTAAFFFRGLITRVISQVILTTILSFVGFVALFNALGFQIIPPKQIAGINIPGASNFSVQSVPDPATEGGYTIKSPWSKEKSE